MSKKMKSNLKTIVTLLLCSLSLQATPKYPLKVVECKGGAGPLYSGFLMTADSSGKYFIEMKTRDRNSVTLPVTSSIYAWNYEIPSLYSKYGKSLIHVNAKIDTQKSTAVIITPASTQGPQFSDYFSNCRIGGF